MQFASACSEDVLDRNWQRLILTRSGGKTSCGCADRFRTHGSADIADCRKSPHQTYRGRRFPTGHLPCSTSGNAQWKEHSLRTMVFLPTGGAYGESCRAMSDITRMNGSFEAPETEGNNSVLTGSVPVASMGDYGKEGGILYQRSWGVCPAR